MHSPLTASKYLSQIGSTKPIEFKKASELLDIPVDTLLRKVAGINFEVFIIPHDLQVEIDEFVEVKDGEFIKRYEYDKITENTASLPPTQCSLRTCLRIPSSVLYSLSSVTSIEPGIIWHNGVEYIEILQPANLKVEDLYIDENKLALLKKELSIGTSICSELIDLIDSEFSGDSSNFLDDYRKDKLAIEQSEKDIVKLSNKIKSLSALPREDSRAHLFSLIAGLCLEIKQLEEKHKITRHIKADGSLCRTKIAATAITNSMKNSPDLSSKETELLVSKTRKVLVEALKPYKS